MMLPYIFLIFSLILSHISRAYFFTAKGVAFRYIGSGSGDFLFTDKRPSSSWYDFACTVCSSLIPMLKSIKSVPGMLQWWGKERGGRGEIQFSSLKAYLALIHEWILSASACLSALP